jgi:DNA-binding MarR family transcriptional regulator
MNLTSKELEIQLQRVRRFESNVTFQFSTISKLMDQNAQEHLKDTSLNLTAYRLMRTVEAFETISIADLSRHMVTDSAQISRTASELGKKGLVSFETDPKSKRRKLVVLSESGKELLAHVAPRFAARQQAIADCLGPDLRVGLGEAFERLTKHFSQ